MYFVHGFSCSGRIHRSSASRPPWSAPETCAPPRRSTTRRSLPTLRRTIIGFTSTATMPLLDADGNAVLQRPRQGPAGRAQHDLGFGHLRPQDRPCCRQRRVDFVDPKLRVRSVTGRYDIDGAANFDQANFQLMDRNGRGFAKDIDVLPGRQGAARPGALHQLSGRQRGLDAAGLLASISTPRCRRASRTT